MSTTAHLFNVTVIEALDTVIFVFSSGCKRSMNHLKEGLDHEAKHRCRYSAQYDNHIYTCKASTPPLPPFDCGSSVTILSVVNLNLSGLL